METNISPMLLLMLLPMAVGFVLLFVPNKLSAAGKFITLVISAVALYLAIGIVTSTGERKVFLWDGEDDKETSCEHVKL